MIKKKIISLIYIIIGVIIFVTVSWIYNTYMSGKLIHAIIEDDTTQIEKYMCIPFNINTKYRIGLATPITPLETACGYGNFELAKKMVLTKGADVNYRPEKNMGLAIDSVFLGSGNKKPKLSEYIDIVDFFIKHNVDMESSIILAVFSFGLKDHISDFGEENTIKLINYLLDNGAVYSKSQLITESSRINNLTILKHLIEERSIEINYEEYHDRLALLFAVDESSYETIEYLVDIGFRQDITYDVGEDKNMTALEIAIKRNDKRMIDILEGGQKK